MDDIASRLAGYLNLSSPKKSCYRLGRLRIYRRATRRIIRPLGCRGVVRRQHGVFRAAYVGFLQQEPDQGRSTQTAYRR